MGTSFGLGMYLDVPHTAPMLVGGIARDLGEEKIDSKSRKDKKKKERLLLKNKGH